MSTNLARSEEMNVNHQTIWRNKQFIFLWTGSSISNLTFHIFTLAIPLIIYDLTQSTLAMSTMRTIEIIPNVLLGILIGVFVDRMNRKKMLMGSIGVQLATIISIILLMFSSNLQLWHLYVLGFLLYSSGYAFGNAYHTIMPLIMSKDQLTSANSALSFIGTLINIIGPAFAGFILLYINYTFGLMITVIGMLILLVLTSFVRVPEIKVDRKQSSSLWHDIKEGWEQLVSTKDLWFATLMVLASNFASALSGAVLIFFALDVLIVDSKQLGFVFSAAAVGGIVGALIAKKCREWIGRGKVFVLAFGFASIGQFTLFLSTDWYWLMLGMLLIGFQVTLFNIHYLSLRQEATPNHLLGRVAGTSSMLMKLAMPVGYLVAGVMGEFISVHYIFLGSSILFLIIVLRAINTSIMRLQ